MRILRTRRSAHAFLGAALVAGLAAAIGVDGGGIGTTLQAATAPAAGVAAPSAVAQPALPAWRLAPQLTATELHFHGNPSDDPPCTGNGANDIAACNGPKLLPTPTLGTGSAGHWDPPTPGINGTSARNTSDPNWIWTLSGPTRLGGNMTVEWWASCGACGAPLNFSADWFIRIWADGVKKFEKRVTATPDAANVPKLLSATVYLADNQTEPAPADTAITAASNIVLHIDPVFIDAQQNTHIYYDSQSPCPDAPGSAPCDSKVTMPVLAPGEPVPPPPVPAGGNPTYTTGGITFGPATVVDAQRTEGEPLNFVDPSGDYWESGPYGASTNQSFIHRSKDGGDQFNVVSPVGLRPDPPPGGGDTDVVVDDQGYVYFIDLEALVNIGCAVSNDKGNTWKKNPACVATTVDDRQWLAVDNGLTSAPADNTVFHGYRQVPAGSFIYSTQGSTGPADPTGGVFYVNSATTPGPVNTGAPCGQMRFDPVLRNLYYACRSGDHVQVTVGHVNPSQRSAIEYVKRDTPPSPGGGAPGRIFPTYATDRGGNLYVAWVDATDNNVYYVSSTDAGITWGPVMRVNSPPAKSNVFVWAQGGSAGTLVLAWLGIDSAMSSDALPNWSTDPAAADDHKWYGYTALITNAHTSAPTINQNAFTPKPMHYGQICTGGTACTGDRTMADYFAIYLDGIGSIRAVYNDTTSQYHGAHVFEVRQLTGPTATGGTASRPVPTNPRPDPTNDAQWPHYSPLGPGPNLPQLDLTGVRLSRPDATTLRVHMTVANLASTSPPPGKTNAVWLTRFQALSNADTPNAEAYRILYVGAESVNGGPLTYFAGSGSSTAVPPNCNPTTPGNCKIVQYPPEVAVTGQVVGNTICVDVPNFATNGFGTGRPINGDTLFSVTGLTAGRNNSATDVYADVDASAAFDQPVAALGSFACSTPTAVALRSFTAARKPTSTVLRWRTASEVGLAGFHVYRARGSAWVKLSRTLVRARGSVAGAAYSWRDRGAPARARYRLQAVGLDGTRRWLATAAS